MQIADWLSYTDIEQLKALNRTYGLADDHHSKHDLICSLLREMNNKQSIRRMITKLTDVEYRFLQLLMLDVRDSFSMEELIGKGRQALGNVEESPRRVVVQALKQGWLFPGYQTMNHDLFFIPDDLKRLMIRLLVQPHLEAQRLAAPEYYPNEEHQLRNDLLQFLRFIHKEYVQLAQDGSIYKQQQKQLFRMMNVPMKTLVKKGPRFGFGRCYHLYTDRFSLLYDYAYYQGYIVEKKDRTLCLTEKGIGKREYIDQSESQEMYRFWIRLYRRPIEQLPIVIRWIGLLAQQGWMPTRQVFEAVKPWISPYYYESIESLFQKVIQMMLHVGVISVGKKNEQTLLLLTSSGKKWMNLISVFDQEAIDEEFLERAGKG